MVWTEDNLGQAKQKRYISMCIWCSCHVTMNDLAKTPAWLWSGTEWEDVNYCYCTLLLFYVYYVSICFWENVPTKQFELQEMAASTFWIGNYHWLSHFCVLYLDTNNHYNYNTQSNDWCSSWLFDKDIMCWYQTMKKNLRYKSVIFANLFVRTRSWVHDTVTLVTSNIIFRVVEFSHLVTILFFPSEHCIPTTDLC